ncbi:MAG: lysylphosphatidylglycerol synthase transmembrane domain-containing protein [Chitinophagaceae bacterium]
MANKKFLNILKLLAKTGFTILLVYLVFQKIDMATVAKTIGQSQPLWLILAFFLYGLSQVVSSWRLYGLLKVMGLPLSFLFNLRLYMLGMFYNVFLPGGIGGDGYKLYLLRKKFGAPTRTLLMGILLDRASGLWAITMLAALSVLFLPVLNIPAFWPVLYLFAAIIAFYFCWRWLFKKHLRYFPYSTLRAILVQSIQCVAMICILKSVHLSGDYLPYIFSFLLSTIATVIPVSVGGLGLREYVMIQLSPLLFLDQALAVSASFCFYIISTVAALPGIWFVYRSKDFTSRTELEEAGSAVERVGKASHV